MWNAVDIVIAIVYVILITFIMVSLWRLWKDRKSKISPEAN